jgi:hypothetical protein
MFVPYQGDVKHLGGDETGSKRYQETKQSRDTLSGMLSITSARERHQLS